MRYFWMLDLLSTGAKDTRGIVRWWGLVEERKKVDASEVAG